MRVAWADGGSTVKVFFYILSENPSYGGISSRLRR